MVCFDKGGQPIGRGQLFSCRWSFEVGEQDKMGIEKIPCFLKSGYAHIVPRRVKPHPRLHSHQLKDFGPPFLPPPNP